MTDEEHHDPLPGMRAELEQAMRLLGEVAGEFARGTRALYDAFREEGFNDRQAMYLSAMYWKNLDPPADD